MQVGKKGGNEVGRQSKKGYRLFDGVSFLVYTYCAGVLRTVFFVQMRAKDTSEKEQKNISIFCLSRTAQGPNL